MKMTDLLEVVDKAYPDGFTAEYHTPDGEFKEGQGDGLARFIVSELIETFEGDTDDEQVHNAIRVLKNAQDQLRYVALALEDKQRNLVIPQANWWERESRKVTRIIEDMAKVQGISNLSVFHREWEAQMKTLAAQTLKPGTDEVIEDLDALDYIWDLRGDYAFGPDLPNRFHAIEEYLGRKVRHFWGEGTIVCLPGFADSDAHVKKYGIEVTIPCRCGKVDYTTWARPGCHTGAFCYVYDKDGEYILDLRNQTFVCKECKSKGRS